MSRNDFRVVIDRAGDPWTVEPSNASAAGSRVLRYRHEMGYERAAVAPRPIDELDDAELVRLLEEVRRVAPPRRVAEAA